MHLSSPNAIHLILWFIAACAEKRLQPTFRAFFTIFSVKKSTMHPFYELVQCNKNSKLGSLIAPFKPVFNPDSLKNWSYEFIMLKGGDWAYMPGFAADAKPTYQVPRRLLSSSILESLAGLVKTFGGAWSKSHYYSVSNLKKYRSKFAN